MASSDAQRARPAGQHGAVGVPESSGRSDRTSPSRRNDESWVEVSSQPSSSSLSSIGDDIVTTGLRVGSGLYPHRRRRPQQNRPMPASFIVGHAATHTGATSSQEEYDETESEEDRVMTSSTEAIHPSASRLRQPTTVGAGMDIDTDSDDDENATALGRPSNAPAFRPQPNAFSHPPSYLAHRHSTSSAHQYHPSQSRPSLPNRSHTRSHRGTPNLADNDAALRASLTTLLSCAAAARGLSKTNDCHQPGSPRTGMGGIGAGVVPSSQPMELRLVPESELMAEDSSPPSASRAVGHGPVKAPLRTASDSSAPSATSSDASRDRELDSAGKTKRAATGQGKSTRAVKKKRTATAPGFLDGETSAFISPTLMTWMVSAGVVVLVSVVGFGAGYVIGREVGRQENGALGFVSAGSTANASANCGSDLVRSTSGGTFRRLRWGSMGRSVVA